MIRIKKIKEEKNEKKEELNLQDSLKRAN